MEIRLLEVQETDQGAHDEAVLAYVAAHPGATTKDSSNTRPPLDTR